MATICGRCKVSQIRTNPRAVFTYGSPRVGNRRYVNYLNIELYRWVHNNDIVTRVPPTWLGYTHKGQEVYLNAFGQIRRLTKWQRIKDRWRGFARGLKRGEFDFFSDHSISRYVDCVRAAVEEEEEVTRMIRPFRRPEREPVEDISWPPMRRGMTQGDLRGDCCWRCGRMRGADGEEVGLAAEGGDAVGVEDAGAVVIHQVGEFDFFSDHSISRYVDCVRAAVEEEEEVTRMIRPFRRQEPQPAKEISWPPMRRAA